jgi:tetracycline repressor-like protein
LRRVPASPRLRPPGPPGQRETTVAQIAREAGVSQRTLFRYFGTKEDLIGGGRSGSSPF